MVPRWHQNAMLLSLFLIIPGYSLVAASPSHAISHLFLRNVTTETSELLDCTTQFSADYYGFGVRLGVYFSWLSCYFANTLLPSEIAGSLDTNSIFLLALLASLFHSSLQGEIYQIDGLIIMQLSSGFVFSSLSIWGYRTSFYQKIGPTAIQKFGSFGTHFRLVLAVAISIYGTWFWWEGLEDGLVIAQDPQCQKIYTWFFTELPVRGGIGIYYIAISFGCSIYYGTMFLAAVVAHVVKPIRRGWEGKMDYETGFSVLELQILFNICRVFNLFWIVFCAIMIEMTLNRNHMQQTLARYGHIAYPAQLIPLIVGALSFLRVLWLIHAEWKEGREEASKECNTGVRTTKHENAYLFTFDIIRQFFSLSARPAGMNTPTFEVQQLNFPSALKPWHKRYAVAWLPWLSTIDSWKMVGADGNEPPPDLEQVFSPGPEKQVNVKSKEVGVD